MIPVNQFILGSSDPLLYPSEKMTNSIDEQIAFLQSQKQAINEAYRRNAIPNANKAHEICERYKEVLPNDVEPCDVYVAINAQYHDYAKLFEEWFGGNIDNKVFESAITFWFKDVDFDGDKVWEYFHMNN
ncbi:MAG: hypothetical protein [Bacteriophage sp.]|nr:MAG: hypothetical protein [Bacteriophage sp.]